MKTCKQVVLGGTCWAVGRLLGTDDDVLVIERSASLGAEYFDCYRACSEWETDLQSHCAKQLREEMESRQMLRGERTDFYGLLPVIYEKLKSHSKRLMLMTEVTEIKETSTGYELTVYNQSGKETIQCHEIIDNSIYCVSDPKFGQANIAGKQLNASIHTPSPSAALTSIALAGGSVRLGRTDDELFISCPVRTTADWSEAREKLLEVWLGRPIEFSECLVSAIAKEFDFTFNEAQRELGPSWLYTIPNSYANPLAAVDAGATNPM